MRKKNLYFISIAVFLTAVVFIVFRQQAKEKNMEEKVFFLLERKGPSAKTEEWQQIRSQAKVLIDKVQNGERDPKSLIALATLYIREARVTGNYMYYDQAAMKCVNDILNKDENNFEALSLKSMVLLSEHHFAEAISTAKKAVAINPYNAFIYGTLVDGYVEMGDYKAAVESLEKMISIRPDMRSYARVSYLREIHGDYAGAIEAMGLAVDAGVLGDESTAWTRVQLGHLFEKTGDRKNAEMNYLITLNERPGYGYALAGLGRIALGQKNYDEAIRLFMEADAAVQDNSLKEQLSEAYLLKGDHQKADGLAMQIARNMSNDAKKESSNDSTGHYSDREIAYAWLKVKNYDKAFDHALAEYNRRPSNIDVNEMLAWVYYSKGEYAKALPYINTAMKTNSRNPTLLCRAGLIYSKAGETSKAKTLLQQVMVMNVDLSDNLKSEGAKMLQTL